jgi:hypothetical protein
LVRLLCPDGIDRAAAMRQLNLVDSDRTYADVMSRMRVEIDAALATTFGTQNIDATGKKATRVIELPGSRAPVDVVPTFRHIWMMNGAVQGVPVPQDGVSIFSKDRTWTNNYPVQHNANGISKRSRTLHRFKKVVRSLKRLRDELVERGELEAKQCPSFLIECLVYRVEDGVFLSTGPDERYDRLLQIVSRIGVLLADPQWTSTACEINDIKFLFHSSQGWTLENARIFAALAYRRLTTG